MSIGAFGENFPYTNFHDLNLDWIIKTLKEINEQLENVLTTFETDVTEVREIGEQAAADATHAAESAETASTLAENAQQAAEDAEQSAQEAAQAGIKRRYIFIGDSYGQGWTPDGHVESWITKVKTILNIANDDCISISEGGSGFWVGDTEDTRYLPSMVQRAYDLTTDPDTISDIVFGLGYNDINAFNNAAQLNSNANSTLSKIRTLFPQNPRIWLFGIGYTTNHAAQYKLMSVYRAYASFKGYGFQKLTAYLCEKSFYASDGIHPNANGQERIAQVVSQMLNNGTVEAGEFRLFQMDTVAKFKNIFTNNNFNGPVYSYRQDNRLIITCPTNSFLRTTFPTDNRISISRDPVKIGTYENTFLTGFHNWSKAGQMFPCDIIYQAEGLSGYHCINGYINIAPESDNDNTLYIWLSIFRTTDDFSNYLTIPNVSQIQIAGFNMNFEIIG